MNSNNKILMIASGFKPYAGMKNILVTHLVKQLQDRGYIVDILTTGSPLRDDISGLMDRDVDVKIHRVSSGITRKCLYTGSGPSSYEESNVWRKKLRDLYRKLIFPLIFPDRDFEWILWGWLRGMQLLRSGSYRLLLSDAPPFSDHFVAYFLKRRYGTKWIAHYSDPWVFNPNLNLPRWRRRLDMTVEKRILREMDAVLLATDASRDEYLRRYRSLNPKKTSVIGYGYDKGAFEALEAKRLSDGFSLVYTGSFYEDVRSAMMLLGALQKVPKGVRTIICGSVPGEYKRIAQEYGIDDRIMFLDEQPLGTSLALQKGADVLLLFGWVAGYQIPGKFYEYVGAKRPILAIAYDDGDIAASYVEELNRGVVVKNDTENISKAITKLYELWTRGELDRTFNLQDIEGFRWENRAEKVAEIIDEVLRGK